MHLTEISSLTHPIVKHLVALRKDKALRQTHGTALITGINLIRDSAQTVSFKTLIVETNYDLSLLPSPIDAKTIYRVSGSILKKITGLETPEPIAAEIFTPPPSSLQGKKWILVLDQLSDPGNLGTLLRSALALGWEGVFITPRSADPFNEKALRAAKGATFRIPLRIGSWEELKSLMQENSLTAYLADIQGESIATVTIKSPALLILSNEAHGPSPEARLLATPLSIPMHAEMESLNVATAGSILMYQMKLITLKKAPSP